MNVTWTEAALELLADYYVTIPLGEQREISGTVERINAELAVRGRELGESRERDDRRIWFKDRLMVLFSVLSTGILVTSVVFLRGKKR